jgi:hypothetical protein
MDSSRREDPKLTEVKAVLQRLQQISTEPEALVQVAPEQTQHSPRWVLPASLGLAGAVALGAAAYMLLDGGRLAGTGRLQRPPAQENQAVTESGKQPRAPGSLVSSEPAHGAPRPALEAAVALLSAGHVQAARRQLLVISSEDAADVAWALARSYDPTYLATIRGADAQPNIAEATRWYRAWHAAALKQGLVTPGVSLERIIGAMH